jgi:hypothetical protein
MMATSKTTLGIVLLIFVDFDSPLIQERLSPVYDQDSGPSQVKNKWVVNENDIHGAFWTQGFTEVFGFVIIS